MRHQKKAFNSRLIKVPSACRVCDRGFQVAHGSIASGTVVVVPTVRTGPPVLLLKTRPRLARITGKRESTEWKLQRRRRRRGWGGARRARWNRTDIVGFSASLPGDLARAGGVDPIQILRYSTLRPFQDLLPLPLFVRVRKTMGIRLSGQPGEERTRGSDLIRGPGEGFGRFNLTRLAWSSLKSGIDCPRNTMILWVGMACRARCSPIIMLYCWPPPQAIATSRSRSRHVLLSGPSTRRAQSLSHRHIPSSHHHHSISTLQLPCGLLLGLAALCLMTFREKNAQVSIPNNNCYFLSFFLALYSDLINQSRLTWGV